jgi:hypothetical protein
MRAHVRRARRGCARVAFLHKPGRFSGGSVAPGLSGHTGHGIMEAAHEEGSYGPARAIRAECRHGPVLEALRRAPEELTLRTPEMIVSRRRESGPVEIAPRPWLASGKEASHV